MELNFSRTIDKDGFVVFLNGKGFRFPYPREIWGPFPFKETLTDELMFLWLVAVPILSRSKKVVFRARKPIFFETYLKWMRAELPALAAHSWTDSALYLKLKFDSLVYEFEQEPAPPIHFETDERNSILNFTSGAESLASLRIAREMGLSVFGMFHRDVRYPEQFESVSGHFSAIEKKFDFKIDVIENELNALLSRKAWGYKRSAVTCALEIQKFFLMSLPFAHFRRAKTLLFGNEVEYNFPIARGRGPNFLNPIRTLTGMEQMNDWMQTLTSGSVQISSLLAGSHLMRIQKIIHLRAPEYGSFQISCRWSGVTSNGRWCLDCDTCAEAYLHAVAFGRNPIPELGFQESMLSQKKKKFFTSFRCFDQKNLLQVHLSNQERLCAEMASKIGNQEWIVHEILKLNYPVSHETKTRYLASNLPWSTLPLLDESEHAIQNLLA